MTVAELDAAFAEMALVPAAWVTCVPCAIRWVPSTRDEAAMAEEGRCPKCEYRERSERRAKDTEALTLFLVEKYWVGTRSLGVAHQMAEEVIARFSGPERDIIAEFVREACQTT